MREDFRTVEALLGGRASADLGLQIGPAEWLENTAPLHYSAACGSSEMDRALLRAGTDPNQGCTVGAGLVMRASPLYRAVEGGHVAAVELLLASTDIDLAVGLHFGPMGVAARVSPEEIARWNGHHALAARIAAASAVAAVGQHAASSSASMPPA